MKCDELIPTEIYARFAEEVYDDFGDSPQEQEYYRKEHADAAIAELKQKLEDAKATHYAEMVDVGMENRRLKEERRWRKFTEEKPSEEMEGEDFLVSNGYYSVVCEWRGYWNNDPFCGDKNCDVVKYWMPLPSAPEEDK